jgi:hypothetical protein
MNHTVAARKHRIVVAGALALMSQGAISGDSNASRNQFEELTVTAPRPQIEMTDARIETDVKEQIEAVNRRFAKDLKNDLTTIGNTRIELVIAEVPTRG